MAKGPARSEWCDEDASDAIACRPMVGPNGPRVPTLDLLGSLAAAATQPAGLMFWLWRKRLDGQPSDLAIDRLAI